MLPFSKFVWKDSKSVWIFDFISCQILKLSFMNFISSSSLYIVSSFMISICAFDRTL